MRRLLALGAMGMGVSVLAGAAISSPGPAPPGAFRCHAKWVDGAWARAGHFRGGIDPDYDIVIGRLRFQVGSWRDRTTGLTQKVLWAIDSKYPVSGELVVRGKRMHSKQRWTQRLPMAGNDDPSVDFFPSIMAPPAQGCWKLTLRSGSVVGRMRVWIHGFG